MSSNRFFVQLPFLSLDGAVKRQYYDCMPIVFVCQEETHAREVLSTISSALSSWNIPRFEEEWRDEQLVQLNDHPILNGFCQKLYVLLRAETGQKTITTDYQRDILPLLVDPRKTHIPLRRVDTLAQALVFIMAKGDLLRLRKLGFRWAERRSSPRFQSNTKPNGDDAGIPPQANPPESASASIPVSAYSPRELPSGRKAPRCTKCHQPMKGHSKSACKDLLNVSLDTEIGRLSIHEGNDQNSSTVDQPLRSEPTSFDEAHCFIFPSKYIERVDATIAAQGLKSRMVNLPEAQAEEVAYIVAKKPRPP